MKKFFTVIILLTLTLAAAVSAAASDPIDYSLENYRDAYYAIYGAVLEQKKTVDLTEFDIKRSEIGDIYTDILRTCPEFFFLDENIRYYYERRGGEEYATVVTLEYTMTGDVLEAAQADYESEIQYIVSQVDGNLSDAEKALWVHDYIAASFEYDSDEENFDVYSLFKERRGVCQAYSLAYIAVLRELGIRSVMVASDGMNHAWNLVEIDGEWYHVDLVYDDPLQDRTGRVYHENFLLSDDDIKNTPIPHYGWVSRVECTDNRYRRAFWVNVGARMTFVEGKWYYIDDVDWMLLAAEVEYDPTSVDCALNADAEVIYRFSERWYIDDREVKYWKGIYSGISDLLGNIFFNTPYAVMTYNIDSGKISVYMEMEDDDRLFGINIYKNQLEYLVADSPNNSGRIMYFKIMDFVENGEIVPFPFKDVPRSSESYAAIRYVYNKGLFQGVSRDRFAPHSSLTRAMFVTVLGRLCEVDVTQFTGVSYTDVKSGQWYSPYIEWASITSVVNGIGGGMFDPFGEITHEQMYKIIAKCGEQLKVEAEVKVEDEPLYSDMEYISPWAEDGFRYCIENGLLSLGKPEQSLKPKQAATREEAAVIIANFAKLLGDKA